MPGLIKGSKKAAGDGLLGRELDALCNCQCHPQNGVTPYLQLGGKPNVIHHRGGGVSPTTASWWGLHGYVARVPHILQWWVVPTVEATVNWLSTSGWAASVWQWVMSINSWVNRYLLEEQQTPAWSSNRNTRSEAEGEFEYNSWSLLFKNVQQISDEPNDAEVGDLHCKVDLATCWLLLNTAVK